MRPAFSAGRAGSQHRTAVAQSMGLPSCFIFSTKAINCSFFFSVFLSIIDIIVGSWLDCPLPCTQNSPQSAEVSSISHCSSYNSCSVRCGGRHSSFVFFSIILVFEILVHILLELLVIELEELFRRHIAIELLDLSATLFDICSQGYIGCYLDIFI